MIFSLIICDFIFSDLSEKVSPNVSHVVVRRGRGHPFRCQHRSMILVSLALPLAALPQLPPYPKIDIFFKILEDIRPKWSTSNLAWIY